MTEIEKSPECFQKITSVEEPSSDDLHQNAEMEFQDESFLATETHDFSALDETFVETRIPDDYTSSFSSETNSKKQKLDSNELDLSKSDLNESTMSLDSKSSVVFEQESSNSFTMHLLPNTKIYFHGKISIKVLQGHVQVLGWDMHEGDERKVFSPRGSSLLGIESLMHSSVVQLKAFDSHLTSSLGALLPIQLFSSRKDSINVLPSSRVKIQAERHLDCKFMKKSLDTKVTVISQEWKDTLLNISQASSFYGKYSA